MGIDVQLFGGVTSNKLLLELYDDSRFRHLITCTPKRFQPGIAQRVINEWAFCAFCEKNNPDVVHPTYFALLREPSSPVMVATVHDLIDEKFDRGLSQQLKRRLRAQHFRAATRIIAVSESTKYDIIEHWQIAPERIDVIYHGVPLLPRPAPSPSNSSYLLYVGGRSRYKNFQPLLHAFWKAQIASRVMLLCFGGGPFTGPERRAIEGLDLADRVTQISGDDHLLAACYRNALGLVYCSKYEGFGLPILEAMSVGCPVLALDTSSIPEVTGLAALLVDANDDKELVRGLSEFATDSRLRQQLTESGYENVSRFSWERSAEQHLETYRKAISSVEVSRSAVQ